MPRREPYLFPAGFTDAPSPMAPVFDGFVVNFLMVVVVLDTTKDRFQSKIEQRALPPVSKSSFPTSESSASTLRTVRGALDSPRGHLSRNSRVIWWLVAGMLAATIAAFEARGLSLSWEVVSIINSCNLIFLAVSFFYRHIRRDQTIALCTEGFAQLILVLSLGCMLSYPIATIGMPYRDSILNAADLWMGLDWRAYLNLFDSSPLLGDLSYFAYGSILLQIVVLMTALAVTSRFARIQQYILASALALAVTLVIFIVVPAGGIYSFLNVRPSEFGNLAPVLTTEQIVYLDALRSGQTTTINELIGLITFPSFHTVWAILFMWGFFPVRRLRSGAFLLNLFMIASTPVQGAHYFIDLIGGAIVAVLSISAAVRLFPARCQAP
jgi:membrane-associated phospholipid phosphatase